MGLLLPPLLLLRPTGARLKPPCLSSQNDAAVVCVATAPSETCSYCLLAAGCGTTQSVTSIASERRFVHSGGSRGDARRDLDMQKLLAAQCRHAEELVVSV